MSSTHEVRDSSRPYGLAVDHTGDFNGKLLLHLGKCRFEPFALRRAWGIVSLRPVSLRGQQRWGSVLNRRTIGSLSIFGTLKDASCAIFFEIVYSCLAAQVDELGILVLESV